MNFNIDYKKLSDPLYIAKELIRFPSETPKDEGALLFVEEVLTLLGFECYIQKYSFGWEVVLQLY